jgi:cytosine/adenosine deaminase-related metal-dependent hydrolase
MMTPTGQIDLEPQLQIATTGGAQVTGLAGDAGDIYFAAGDDGVVWKTPNATNSTASPIARAQVAPRAVVIDATWVYWSTGDCAIRSMPR